METETYKGYSIQISHDEDAESPREWDNPGRMLCLHNRYTLGDKHDYTAEDIKEEVSKSDFSMPLFLYDHSGISMSTARTCSWDSSAVGYIIISRKEVDQHLTGFTDEQVMQFLEGQIEVYSQYLEGEVYSYLVDDGEVGSCSGFFGYDNEKSGLMDHAREDIDCYIKEKRKTRYARLKALIKNHVPLFNRSLILNNL